MARGGTKNTGDNTPDNDELDDEKDGATGKEGGKGEPGFQSALEEAWHGWLKPVGGIVLVVLAYVLYDRGVIQDALGGRLLVTLMLGGALYLGIEPAISRSTASRDKALYYGLAAVWAIACVMPLFRLVYWPATPLAESRLVPSEKGGTITQVIQLPEKESGPYEIRVSGALRGSGEAEANYKLTFKGDGEATKDVEGVIKRTYLRERAGRRGGMTTVRSEHGEETHRLGPTVRGNKLSVDAEIAGELLEEGLVVSVVRAWVNPAWFWLLGLVVIVLGVLSDYRLKAPKQDPTYLAAAAGFTLALVIYLPTDATPHHLVRPAVGALVLALFVGALPAWGVSAIVQSYKPRPKKLAGGTKAA